MSDPLSRLNAALHGRYRVERELGEGGMATVYLAEDLRHDRHVALKVLKPELAAIVGAERFLAEIKTTAGLQHPHVLPLHDSGEADGYLFYVMPYVEGESLRDRLDRDHQLPVNEAVRIATDVAEALDYAHRQGVIHRDIKPANILLQAGRPMISDFGIALALRAGGGSRLTETGLSLGTPHYMSPEQATGDLSVGAATDIYALGCVLYEMLVGEPPFTGSTPQAILGKIITGELPSVAAQRKSVPANVDGAVLTALQRVPADRFTSAGRFGEALRDPSFGADGLVPGRSREAEPRPAPARRWVAGAAVAASIALAWWIGRAAAPGADARRPSEFLVSLEQEMAGATEADPEIVSMPSPSPNGHYLVFRGRATGDDAMLWIRPLESADARPLAGTEGSEDAFVWSPDGEWIAFYVGGRLMRIRPAGGPPEPIAELGDGFQTADWGSEGFILFRPSNRRPLYVIHESGGEPRQVSWLNEELAENSHRGPEFLPDGRRFLFTSRSGQRENNGLYLGSIDSPEVRRLMYAESHVDHVPEGAGRASTLLYYSEGALVARPFDADAEAFVADPVPIKEGVSYNAPSIEAAFRASKDGSVIVVRLAEGSDNQLVWFGRDGEEDGTVGPPGRPFQPRISPNGLEVLFSAPDPSGNRDVWHHELGRGITTRLTTHPANEWNGVWSPDGRQILFGSDRDGPLRVHLKESVDPGAPEVLLADLEPGVPRDWSRDGRWISFERGSLTGGPDVLVASMPDAVDPFPFLEGPFVEGTPRFSPNGRWIAYASNETGELQVQVRPFNGGPAASEGRIQISVEGGGYPVWGPDGQELFFMSQGGVLYSVDTAELGVRRAVPPPGRLFRACPGGRPESLPETNPSQAAYDTHDGQRFLIGCRPSQGEFVVLLDWALSN